MRERDGLKDWIRLQVGDNKKVFCRFCKCEIGAHHADLIQYAGAEKHKKKTALSSSMRLTEIGFTSSKPNETRQANELKIATYVACHTSIISVDHLGQGCPKSVLEGRHPAGFRCFPASKTPDSD